MRKVREKKNVNVISLFDGMGCMITAMKDLNIPIGKIYASEVDKWAIKQTKYMYPEMEHVGDVTKWKEWDIDWSEIDMIAGGSPCFVAGTKILTTEGYKHIENVLKGDVVLTHKNKWRKVLNVGFEKKETINIKAQCLFNITTTENHPFYVRRMKRKWNNENRKYVRMFDNPEWINASKLKDGDFLSIPIIKDEENIYNLTKEECFILGRYIADGHTRKDYRVSEGRHNHRYWQLILSIGNKKNFKTSLKHSLYIHTQNVERMVFSNKRLVLIAEKECGCGAINKKIGTNLLKLPVEYLKCLLNGYESGDGYDDGVKIKATSISKELIQSIQLAVAKVYRVGSNVHYYKRPKTTTIEGRIVNQHDSYLIEYRKELKKQSNFFVDNDHIWVRYKGAKRSAEKLVYNLEVDIDNSYIADNCVVHNCTGFSMAGKMLNFDDPQSKLFFVYVEILNHAKKHNPDVIFLLENVQMKKEWQKVINDSVGVFPVMIDAALVSAQTRKRLYWTNGKTRTEGLWGEIHTDITQPQDRAILLKDILQPESEVDEKYYLSDEMHVKLITTELIKEIERVNNELAYGLLNNKGKGRLINKSSCLDANYYKGIDNHAARTMVCVAMRGRNPENPSDRRTGSPTQQRLEPNTHGKTNTITTVAKDNLILGCDIRKDEGIRIRENGKSGTLTARARTDESCGQNVIVQKGRGFNKGGEFKDKSPTITGNSWEQNNHVKLNYLLRRLTVIECMRLQSIPLWYKWSPEISDSQRYKMLGNGWNVEVIKHILKEIFEWHNCF